MQSFGGSSKRPTSASSKKQAAKSGAANKNSSGSYKDWTVREQKVAKARPGSSGGAKNGNKNGSRTRSQGSKSRSRSRGNQKETTDDIKRRVALQYQNYMQEKEDLDESQLSLLENSRESPPREAKKQILIEQKLQRKRSEEARKKAELDEAKKKQDAMKALQLRFRSEAATFRKELEAGRRASEKRDRSKNSNQSSRRDTEKAVAAPKQFSNVKVGKQVTELRGWIENAIRQEHLLSTESTASLEAASAHNLMIPGVNMGNFATQQSQSKPPTGSKKSSKSKTKTQKPGSDTSKSKKATNTSASAILNKSLDEMASRETGKAKLLKHQLPGNSTLSEAQHASLGARKDRYGVFRNDGTTSDFDRVVKEQRVKVLGAGKPKAAAEWKPTKTEASQVKSVINEALKSLGQKADIKVEDMSEADSTDRISSEEEDFEDEFEGSQTPQSEDSSDKIPVKQSPPTRQHRTMINQAVKTEMMEDESDLPVPGVVNTQALFERQEREKNAKEAGAAQVIQKFYRGHKGRKLYARRQKVEKERVEYEYEKLNDELKSDTQYNLKSYLAQKKEIRAKYGAIVDSVAEDEIAEVIGESGSIKSTQYRRQSANAGSAQLQNFFKTSTSQKPMKDPLSLISIFAKRNGTIPSAEGKSQKLRADKAHSRERSDRHTSSRHHLKHSAQRKGGRKVPSSESGIEEEYSNDFSDSLPKEESIIEEEFPRSSSGISTSAGKLKSSSGPGMVRSYGANKDRSQKGGKGRDETDSIATEVIDEEDSFAQSASARDESIKEESIVNEIESDLDVGSKKPSDSIAEDSIIREEYDNDNHAIASASQSLQARNRVRFGMHSAQLASSTADQPKKSELDKVKDADQLKLAEEQAHKTLERNRMIGDLMTEMREYEKASMSNVIVDRMEKIIASSLAQKDQIIMAQRLSELEAEKRHKEEINKIREEQIKLMSQLMLMGSPGVGQPTGQMSEKYRQDLLDSIKKIIDKPIQIKNETVHVNYSVSQAADDQLAASATNKLAASHSARKSYLQEYEESKRQEKQGSVVTASQSKYQQMIEEDISLRLGKGAFDVSQSKGGLVQDSIEDMVGDVTSAIEESIKDEVVDSHSKISASKVSRSSKDDPHVAAPGAAASRVKKASMDPETAKALTAFAEVERAIDSERSEREERLARDLKKRRITPSAYDKGIKEIEKWVIKEKRELQQRRRKLEESNQEVNKYVERFKKDKRSIPMLGVSTTPRNDSALLSFNNEDSLASDQVQAATRQAYLLDKELAGMSPEQKYAMKKREAAENLFEQKEKAIQKALNEKMNKYQGGRAEEMLQKALELDIEAEVERRFDAARRDIEESRNLESARSARSARSYQSASQEKGPHTGRTKKSVQFDKSVKSHSTKPSSTVYTERVRATPTNLDDDSIQESIQLAESISQSLRSQSAIEVSQSRSAKKVPQQSSTGPTIKEKFSPQQHSKTQSQDGSDQESLIESDYSQEFTEYSQTSKDISQSGAQSKLKLQAKAKDIEESAAYSETFEEESLGKSATYGKDESASKDKMLNMHTVKEESVDDSAAEQSKDVTQSIGSESKVSRNTPHSAAKVESSIGSLPSDDLTVLDSVRSVEWKYEVKESAPQSRVSDEQSVEASEDPEPSQLSSKKASFIKEERVEDSQSEEVVSEEQIDSEESSDLNTRDEMGDLESCPEGVGQSQSLSGNDMDVMAQADAITDELLELIMMDYKNEEGDFDLNASPMDQPDEEDYRDKFPWTMDKKPEPKPSPKPLGVKMGAQPRPPKTQRELKDEAFKTKHDEKTAELANREDKIVEFLDFMCKRVDLKELMESLNRPIKRDPLKILSQIVNCYDEEDSIGKEGEESILQAQQQILQQAFFNKTDREFVITERMKTNTAAVDDTDQLTVSQEEMENINNVHHYSLFEALNEALDTARPYQNKGEPMPWSKNTRTVKKVETEAQAKAVLLKARDQVVKWMKMRAGTNLAPLPDAPPQTQDEMGEEITPPPLEDGEDERRNIHRQEKLADLMTDDIVERDALWIDYEVQDTQTRFDVADMILHHLAGEIAEFLAVKTQQ